MITGHSVFSQMINRGPERVFNQAGYKGNMITSIEDVDERVESYSVGPHPEWVDDYLRLKARRGPVGAIAEG